MLYAILLETCRWLEYCICYCQITAEVNLEDFYTGEYYELNRELCQTSICLYDQVLANNDPTGNGKNYSCFI